MATICLEHLRGDPIFLFFFFPFFLLKRSYFENVYKNIKILNEKVPKKNHLHLFNAYLLKTKPEPQSSELIKVILDWISQQKKDIRATFKVLSKPLPVFYAVEKLISGPGRRVRKVRSPRVQAVK